MTKLYYKTTEEVAQPLSLSYALQILPRLEYRLDQGFSNMKVNLLQILLKYRL